MGAGGGKKVLPAGFWRRLFAPAQRLRRKAEANARAGRVKEALALYQSLLALYSEDVELHLAVADLFFQVEKWEEAARHYWEALSLDVGCVGAYRGYLAALQRLGRLEEAAQALRELGRARPESPCPPNYLGVALYLNGSITEAAQIWEEVLEKHPKFAPAHSNLGSVHLQQGDFARALFRFQLAAELDPGGSAVAYNNMGEVYLLRGDYAQAMGFFQRAIELDPRLAIPYANLGHCYYAVGKWEEAIAVYEKALSALNPGLSSDDTEIEVLTCLTRVYARLRQYDRAIEVGLRVLARRPGWERILALLGHIYLQKGEFEKAVEYLQRALLAGGGEWLGFALHRNLALVYYRMGRFKEAVIEYKMAYATYFDQLFADMPPWGGGGGSERWIASARF
ncbi:MAG: tetratricopeptide repeat protein [Bacillota bacterium]|nr:tetratricopeptide repeat protein [Bacillota bacterium]